MVQVGRGFVGQDQRWVHGTGKGSVTLGGRRVPVDRPRTRTVDGHEVPLTSYTHFAVDDMLMQVVMERMLAGVATRRHPRTAEPGAGRAAAGLRTGSPHARRIVIAPAPMWAL
jgi:hypothetical protein